MPTDERFKRRVFLKAFRKKKTIGDYVIRHVFKTNSTVALFVLVRLKNQHSKCKSVMMHFFFNLNKWIILNLILVFFFFFYSRATFKVVHWR